MEITRSDKHASLLWHKINYDCKKFYSAGPRLLNSSNLYQEVGVFLQYHKILHQILVKIKHFTFTSTACSAEEAIRIIFIHTVQYKAKALLFKKWIIL